MNKVVEERRKVLQALSVAPFAMSAGLFGCASDNESTVTTTNEDNNDNGSEGSTNTGSENTSEWASGDTDLITVDFPDSSIFDSGSTCSLALTQSTTEGPCYFADATGEDISAGLSGLPLQLCLKLIDNNCEPLENYVIEVWHCDHRGVYSGDTSESLDASRFAGSFCTDNDSAAMSSTWYRGQLTTDSEGRVNFKSCFPGWYAGRTIHIHFGVSDANGSNSVISQLCFTDELTKEICTTHDIYSSRGEQDQPISSGRDTVFPSSGYDSYLLTTEKNSDNTMLAYHTIQIA